MENYQQGEKQFNIFMWGFLIILVIALGILTNWIIAAVITALSFCVYLKWLHNPQEVPFQRYAIPQWVKEQVWQTQKGLCSYCGQSFQSKYDIEWHHIKPVSHGGSNDAYNIVAIHSYHHNHITRNRGF